ncbi:MAG: hypothetical protein PVJ09_05460 [Candidatus Woesebacteria bacterium]|jgi:hypothetical protein
MKDYKNSDTLKRLRVILAEMTGNDLSEILPESHLEADLGLILEEDFPRLLPRVTYEFAEDDLELDMHEILEQLEEAGETVLELAKIISEERDLG